jgi:prepilin peptidase CpaA
MDVRVAPAVTYSVLGLLLVVAVYTDFRWGKIRNWTTLPAVVLGLALNGAFHGVGGLVLSAEGLGLAIAISLVLSVFGRVVGAGDMKLLMAVGALVGPKLLLWAVVYGVLTGGVAAVGVALFHGRLGRELRMLFSSLASRAAAVSPLDYKTSESTRLPYALPLAAGVIMSIVAQGGVMLR